ncbi:FISUMP domain-containing protein [Candidatus Neomarinimicrobiota bacterium]
MIPTFLNVEIDSTYQFSAIGKDEDMNVIEDLTFAWTSTSLAVGTIDQNGLFATKSLGTTFISAKSGSTESEQVEVNVYESVFITDIDNNIYKIVKIGEQWWMAENLKVTHYSNGDPIPNVRDDTAWLNLTSGAYCDYNNNYSNGDTYGHLYNWAAVDDNRGLASEGWHIPTDEEWKELEIYLGLSESDYYIWGHRGTDEGTKLKSTYGWNNNGNGTNIYGFAALPGGHRYFDEFTSIGQLGGWWSSTIADASNNSFVRGLFNGFSGIHRSDGDWQSGFSVRCIKD